jgi:hypothetical protein
MQMVKRGSQAKICEEAYVDYDYEVCGELTCGTCPAKDEVDCISKLVGIASEFMDQEGETE